MKVIIEVGRILGATKHKGEFRSEDGSVLGSFEIDDRELQKLNDSGVLDEIQNIKRTVFKGCFEKISCD